MSPTQEGEAKYRNLTLKWKFVRVNQTEIYLLDYFVYRFLLIVYNFVNEVCCIL